MIIKLFAVIARLRWHRADSELERLVYDLKNSDSYFLRQIAREIERQERIR